MVSICNERKRGKEKEREKVGESNPFNTSHQSVSASNESSRIGLSRPPTEPLQSRKK